jgi:acyl-[acyl-carrier-protein] desaturase
MSRWALGTPFDRLYKSFFDRAERHRRWRLDDDIAWADLAPEAAPELVGMVETFWAVESFLPDYTARIAAALRTERARMWAHVMWAYEESKHARALEEWLLRGSHRTEDDLNTLADRMWTAGSWELPYASDRQFLIYQMLQEANTRLVYANTRHLAKASGDRALDDVLRHLASDEQAHHAFFRSCVQQWQLEDPEGTAADLYTVLVSFRMPVGEFIPDYPARARVLAERQIGSPYLFAVRVWIPLARTLGIDPIPPPLRFLATNAGYTAEDLASLLHQDDPAALLRGATV